MGIKLEPGWRGLAKKLKGRTTVFIGKTDAGKTTLIKYLLGGILSLGGSVALVDSDIGQSSLGLPGTVSMKTFRSPADMEDFKAEKMSFIGVTNPALKIALLVESTRKVVMTARKEGAQTVLVDTTGLVAGGLGRALKLAKIRAIGPEFVVAVERAGELQHIIERVEAVRVVRLRVSRFAKGRTASRRAKYRHERFKEYFRDSREIAFQKDRVRLCSVDGEPLDLEEVPSRTLVALNRYGETRALGIISGVKDSSVTVKTPMRSSKSINRVLVGDIRLEGLLVER